MEERTDSQTAVKVEEHNQYVILTYFHGDINSMVDAHFSRALSRSCKAKAPKKPRKYIKSEDSASCESRSADSYPEAQPAPPVAGHVLTFNCADGPQASWHTFGGRTTDNPAVPSLAYSLSQEGLSLTGQQYASSLLNLLHSDRGEMGGGMASCSKPELLPGWRDPVDSTAGYEPGRRLDKKDLYWY